jgi:hypothetical protein
MRVQYEFAMERDLPRGVALCLDAAGMPIRTIRIPQQRPPDGATKILMSVADFAQLLGFAPSPSR